MKNRKHLFSIIGSSLVLISAACLFAQDWNQWRGTNRESRVTGFIAPKKWPAELSQKWRITVGNGDATPALVGNRLYVFTRQDSHEVTMCLDAKSGKELWQDKYSAQIVPAPAGSHPGPRSSPAVSDGKIITLGVGGILSCLETATSKVLWRNDEYTDTVPTYFTAMSPLIVDGMCIAHLGGKDNGKIVAFDIVTGEEKWKWTGDGPAYASPVLVMVGGLKQITVQTESRIVGIAVADGKLLWDIQTPPQRRFYNSATPIIHGDIIICTGQGSGTKAVKVQKQGAVFTVQPLWSNEELGTAYNTPVLKDGFLYSLSDRGRFYCMNAASGQVAWTDETSHKNFGSLLDAGSVILALTSDSDLIVFKPDSKKYTELARIKVADTSVYANPVVSGNRIYVKDQETLTLYTIE